MVKNVGPGPAFRVRAVLDSDDPSLDELEIPFGKVAPAETRTVNLTIDPTRDGTTTRPPRTAHLRATLVAQDLAPAPAAAEVMVQFPGTPTPALAYRFQVAEAAQGSNHDGRIQRGESLQIPVTVTNTGSSPVPRLLGTLEAGQGQDRVMIPVGRLELTDLQPGASKAFTFSLSVGAAFRADQCALDLALQDPEGQSFAARKLRIDLGPRGANGAPAPKDAVEVTPPRLTVSGPAVTTAEVVRVTGTAVDDQLVRDVFIRVWNRNDKLHVRRVFQRPNVDSANPKRMDFEADVPLGPGANFIQVIARESTEATAMQELIVLRRPEASSKP